MKITMIHTSRGSEDGFSVKVFEEGKEYDLSNTLAAHFLKIGVAYNSEPEPEQPLRTSSVLEQMFYNISMNQYNRRIIQNPQTFKDIGDSI